MKIFEWMAELRFRNNLLYRVGLMNLILSLLLLFPLVLDSREVMGINSWIKPLKFSISLWIYTWTFGWILFDLPNSRKWIKGISWVVGITMMIEIIVIIYQAAGARQSHFNISTDLDAILFSTMGIAIGINTVAIVLAFILFLFKKPKLDTVYLLALRLGFVVFIIGNWVGGQMIKNMSHSIGVDDGGPGLPFTNWSTIGGDLRIAHFLGLHALQLIPLLAFLLLKKTSLGANVRMVLSVVFAIVYAGIVSFLYVQAANGVPLFSNN